MKFISSIAIILVLVGWCCTKEESTISYASIFNSTSHKIVVKPFFSGAIPPDKIITLFTNQIQEIATASFVRGKGDYGFSTVYFGGLNDSIIVTFDDKYSITHYFNPPANLNSKYYVAASLRNIANPKSYTLESKDSRLRRENRYTYTFTEQDYLDAK